MKEEQVQITLLFRLGRSQAAFLLKREDSKILDTHDRTALCTDTSNGYDSHVSKRAFLDNDG